jgi:hypothetical protein
VSVGGTGARNARKTLQRSPFVFVGSANNGMVRHTPIGKAEATRTAAVLFQRAHQGFPAPGRSDAVAGLQPMDETTGQNRSITPI